MVRAIPLPGGVGDLFKGCRDQNENQLVLGLCPFIMQGEPASLLVSPWLSFNTHKKAKVGFGVKVEKVEMHVGMVELSLSGVIEEVLVGA